jgi:hypothetical protein
MLPNITNAEEDHVAFKMEEILEETAKILVTYFWPKYVVMKLLFDHQPQVFDCCKQSIV